MVTARIFAVMALAMTPQMTKANVAPALPKTAPAPAANPTTDARVELGKMLYFDPRLSKDGTISCNSCHNVFAGGDDDRPNSIGVKGQAGGRSAPTVYNAAFLSVQFWDGRAPSLEEQAKGPLTNPIEMGMENHDVVVSRIKQVEGYHAEFAKAFGSKDDITIDNVAKAIAAFERTLITPNSPYDKYVGGDKKALTDQQKRGLQLVQDVGCTSCHSGVAFAGPPLPEGTGFFQKFPVYPGTEYEKKYKLTADPGRFEATQKEEDRQLWRVAPWRNIALTAPYFHNGSVPTLDEAVRVMAKTQLNKDLKDEEVQAIVAFLTSLTGEFPSITAPRLPEAVGTTIVN